MPKGDISNQKLLGFITLEHLAAAVLGVLAGGGWLVSVADEVTDNAQTITQLEKGQQMVKKNIGEIKTDVAVIKATVDGNAKNIERILRKIDKLDKS